MADPYLEIEPYEHGMLDVGDGQRVYWETCGKPGRQVRGLPARWSRFRLHSPPTT
jgi:hypothetical protein